MVPCGFNLYFSNDVEHILMRLVAIYISSSVKYLIKSFCWFLKLGCFFFSLLFREFPIYYEWKFFIRYMICKYGIPIFVLLVLHFTVLCRYWIFFKIEGLWQPCIGQVCQHHFPKRICSLCGSVSYFGNTFFFFL